MRGRSPGRTRSSLARSSALTLAFTGLILVTNLVTGVLVARELGPSGRGELAAITNTAVWMSVLFNLGCREAISYHQSRHPEDAGRLMSTWLILLVPVAFLAVLVGELLLPVLFSAQTDDAVDVARVYLLAAIPLLLLTERLHGALLGDRDFSVWNVVRLAQPGLVAIGYILLWQFGELSVRTALATIVVVLPVNAVLIAVRFLKRHRLARPNRALGRATLWYGFRGQLGDTFALVNARLDVLIIPAFLSAASVGYYSVATNVSWMIISLATPLFSLILPTAAHQGAAGVRTVVRSLQGTLVLGGTLAVVIGLLADVVIRVVYGANFAASSLPLRLLLPGSVLYGGAAVLAAGLYAAGRPFTAAFPQVAGMVVTAIGLLLFLRSGGIEVAAIVSTLSYTLVFFLSLVLYQRTAGIPWRTFVSASPRSEPVAATPAEQRS